MGASFPSLRVWCALKVFNLKFTKLDALGAVSESLEWQMYQLQDQFNPRHIARFVLAVFNQGKGDVRHGH